MRRCRASITQILPDFEFKQVYGNSMLINAYQGVILTGTGAVDGVYRLPPGCWILSQRCYESVADTMGPWQIKTKTYPRAKVWLPKIIFDKPRGQRIAIAHRVELYRVISGYFARSWHCVRCSFKSDLEYNVSIATSPKIILSMRTGRGDSCPAGDSTSDLARSSVSGPVLFFT